LDIIQPQAMMYIVDVITIY